MTVAFLMIKITVTLLPMSAALLRKENPSRRLCLGGWVCVRGGGEVEKVTAVVVLMARGGCGSGSPGKAGYVGSGKNNDKN